jgi:hypothetical protein
MGNHDTREVCVIVGLSISRGHNLENAKQKDCEDYHMD